MRSLSNFQFALSCISTRNLKTHNPETFFLPLIYTALMIVITLIQTNMFPYLSQLKPEILWIGNGPLSNHKQDNFRLSVLQCAASAPSEVSRRLSDLPDLIQSFRTWSSCMINRLSALLSFRLQASSISSSLKDRRKATFV